VPPVPESQARTAFNRAPDWCAVGDSNELVSQVNTEAEAQIQNRS